MFTRVIILFLPVASAIGCQQCKTPKAICQQFSMPAEVSEQEIEDLYKEAMWQVYKFNLVETDSFEIKNPFYDDSVYTETSLSEFDLEFGGVERVKDTVIFNFFFERGVYPAGHTYYGTVAFWGDKEKIEIGDRISFVMEKEMYEPEFDEYLRENEGRLSPMLKCLVAERKERERKK